MLKSYLLPAITFVLGVLCAPAGELLIGSLADRYDLFEEAPIISVALPLEIAQMVLRDEHGQVLASGPTTAMNEVSVIFSNDTDDVLTDFRMLIQPLSSMDEPPTLLQSTVEATGLLSSEGMTATLEGPRQIIEAERVNPGEHIFIESNYDQPIGLLIEVISAEQSWTRVSGPGCDESEFEYSASTVVARFLSDQCHDEEDGTFGCTIESESLPFTITEDMRGRPLEARVTQKTAENCTVADEEAAQ